MNKARIFYFSIFLTFLLCCFKTGAFAQEPLPADIPEAEEEAVPVIGSDELEDLPVEVVEDIVTPDPGISAFYSAVLPGLGQAYNGSHWKIPLIYIGGAFVASSVNFNNRRYSTALRNLDLIINDPNVTFVENDRGQEWEQQNWEQATNFYRRNRDYTIILGCLLYGLNILDAYVDAHLQDFDVSDDLSLRIKPSLISTPGGQAGTGIALTLHFK